jgi:hypothetical protein
MHVPAKLPWPGSHRSAWILSEFAIILLSGHRVDDGRELCEFVLGKQIDMKVEVGALVRCLLHSVLTDQDERRQKDSFNGRLGRKNDKAWVERLYTRHDSNVDQDPGGIDK